MRSLPSVSHVPEQKVIVYVFFQSTRRAKNPPEVVHSDVCGKIGTKSFSVAECFVTIHRW